MFPTKMKPVNYKKKNPPIQQELHLLFNSLVTQLSAEFLFMQIYILPSYKDLTDLNDTENAM